MTRLQGEGGEDRSRQQAPAEIYPRPVSYVEWLGRFTETILELYYDSSLLQILNKLLKMWHLVYGGGGVVEGQPDEEKGGMSSQERWHAHCSPAAHRYHHLKATEMK